MVQRRIDLCIWHFWYTSSATSSTFTLYVLSVRVSSEIWPRDLTQSHRNTEAVGNVACEAFLSWFHTHVNQTDSGLSPNPSATRYCSNHVRVFYLRFKHPMLSACLWSDSLFQTAWKESTYCVYSGPPLSLSSPSRLSPAPFAPCPEPAEDEEREKKRGG